MIAPPRPPEHDELEALIKEARARQMRRRLIGAGSLAVAAAIALGAYAMTIRGSAEHTGSTSRSRGAGTSLCRTTELSTSVGFQGATGSLLGGATITNTGRIPCALPTKRPIVSVSWNGRSMPTLERAHNPQGWPNWKPATVLQPGAQAAVLMQWWNYCGASAGRAINPTFELRLGQLALRATAYTVRPPFCNSPGAPSRLYVSRPLAPR